MQLRPSEAIQQFALRRLDCAACAAKLEDHIRQVPGVKSVSLDFAGLRLHLEAQDIPAVLAAVRQVEPEVQLIAIQERQTAGSGEPHESPERQTREMAILAVAALLYLVQLTLSGWFRQQDIAWVQYPIAATAYLLCGWNVLRQAARTLRRGLMFDENVLMTIATLGAMAIDALDEAVGVMLFYKIGELLQQRAVSRSRRSIRALLAARPDSAMRQTPAGLETVTPEVVQVGETIVVRPGEKVPLDGQILAGETLLDTAALTGESVPRLATTGDQVLAGQINLRSMLTVRVTRPFAASSIARVLALVEGAAARKASTEKFITTFARYYTPAVVAIAAAIAVIPPLAVAEARFAHWFYRALVLLVISCPCALMISIPLGYFGGIGRASRRGILVKGSNFIDALARVKTVVFDKTGTLTHGAFAVQAVVNRNGFTPQAILELAAAAEYHSRHPIAEAVRRAFAETGGRIDAARITAHEELAGSGVRVRYGERTILVGNDPLLHREAVAHDLCQIEGSVAHVAIDGHYAGYLRIGDALRPEAAEALAALRAAGVGRIEMLTGDNRCTAERVAGQLRLDGFHAELLPEDKVAALERIAAETPANGTVAFVGDGINDAPVIARADVGIAMGGLGSDAAIESADVVLMADSPAKVAEALAIARQTRSIVWQNIVLALAVKLVFVSLGALGLASMWEAVFADMGTAVIATLNATRALAFRQTTVRA